MNRIITILVTIFILLLLYIWISHVWGSDETRRPKQIVDATGTNMSDGLTADSDTVTTVPSAPAVQEEPVTTDDFSTERKVSTEHQDEGKTETPSKPAGDKTVTGQKVETKKSEPARPVSKPAEKNMPVSTTVAPKTTNTPAKTNTAPVKTNTSPAKTTTAVSSGLDGKHLVIAGNFSQLANAQQRVAELKKAGFPDAEVINFDLSEYHTVCVGRFADVNEARRLVKKLKDYHKIDAYVRIGS